MSATGGPQPGSMYVVHYRREDGTEASRRAVPCEYGFSWTAPEDCATITGLTEICGGGGLDEHSGDGGAGWGGGE